MAAYGDMFLKVGSIKGEANDEAHKNEIDVLNWSWGMKAVSAMSAGGQASKCSVDELMVEKEVDCASTALMSAMKNNEKIGKVVLTARKAGEKPIDFFKITIQQARITSYDVNTSSSSNDRLVERLTFAFKKIDVEYIGQDENGRAKGGMVYSDEIN